VRYSSPIRWSAPGLLVLFVVLAMLFSRILRAAVHAAMSRQGTIDRTTMSFVQQFGFSAIWVIHAHSVCASDPHAALDGHCVAGGPVSPRWLIGLAAQSTLGNLVAGVSITIYKPFRLGDTLQVATPTAPRSASSS